VLAHIAAAPALLGALLHLLIALPHLLAIFRAPMTDLGAGTAGVHVQVRAADEEIVAGAADGNAVHQQPNVIRAGVFPAAGQAVLERLRAGVATAVAFFGALFEFSL